MVIYSTSQFYFIGKNVNGERPYQGRIGYDEKIGLVMNFCVTNISIKGDDKLFV